MGGPKFYDTSSKISTKTVTGYQLQYANLAGHVTTGHVTVGCRSPEHKIHNAVLAPTVPQKLSYQLQYATPWHLCRSCNHSVQVTVNIIASHMASTAAVHLASTLTHPPDHTAYVVHLHLS